MLSISDFVLCLDSKFYLLVNKLKCICYLVFYIFISFACLHELVNLTCFFKYVFNWLILFYKAFLRK